MSQRQVSAPAYFRCPADLRAEVTRRASADGRCFSNFVVHALRRYIEATPPKRSRLVEQNEAAAS